MQKKILTAICLLLLAQPAIAQEREWALDAAEEDVYLLFGVPNTNDVGVSFWCKIDTGIVSLFAPVPANSAAPKSVVVSVGTKTYELATTETSEENAGTIEAKLLPQIEILTELQSAERFSMNIGNHKSVFPLMGADFTGLMKLCASPPAPQSN